jgi:choline dehydrogenase-like flavoprotein
MTVDVNVGILARGNDPWAADRVRGFHIVDAAGLERDLELEADVAIVGTGAGGGTAAEILAQAGLAVIMVEEGPLATAADFRMRESEAYPTLYQESAARKTRDKAIGILQGRCVGGSTTVNWTSSFPTISRRGSSAWRRDCRSRPGTWPRTRTTKRWRAARRSSAFPRPRSGATSRAAGI